MRARRYVQVRYPWRAAVGTRSAHPARFYVALIGQALRYGLPAARRPARAWTLAGRLGLPEAAIARCLRAGPRRARPDLDALLARVTNAWPRLAERSERLGAPPARLSALVLERRSARTTFVFGDSARPLLVLKEPPPGDRRAGLEAAALREAEPAGIAPRHLGRVGEAEAQEALPGTAMAVEPLSVERCRDLAWPASLHGLTDGLMRLAEATAKAKPPEQWRSLIDRALAERALTDGTHRLLSAAARDVGRLERSVLCHRDPSPQNCIYRDGRLEGLVDWETALSRGLPGLDAWIAAISYFEHSLGLVRWGDRLVIDAFELAWREAPFYRAARASVRATAIAGGVDERHVEALELVFCGARLGHRLQNPDGWATTAAVAISVLEAVADP